MELGEPDESGRACPVPVEGSEFVFPADAVVLSIGISPTPLVTRTTPGLDTTEWGGIIADEGSGRASERRVYAGGDAVMGTARVILPAGAGKEAAAAIHTDLSGGNSPAFCSSFDKYHRGRTPANSNVIPWH